MQDQQISGVPPERYYVMGLPRGLTGLGFDLLGLRFITLAAASRRRPIKLRPHSDPEARNRVSFGRDNRVAERHGRPRRWRSVLPPPQSHCSISTVRSQNHRPKSIASLQGGPQWHQGPQSIVPSRVMKEFWDSLRGRITGCPLRPRMERGGPLFRGSE
jgi:hypothetical protein